MRNLFLLIAMLLMVSLGGCTVVVHDTGSRRTYQAPNSIRAYCTMCGGYGCTHQHHRSYYRTVVVEKTYHTPSSRRYAAPRRVHTRYVHAPSAPAAPRQVRRSYNHSTRRQVSRSRTTTYQSSRTRREASRSRSSVRQAPSRQTVSRSSSRSARKAGREQTTERTKRRR